MRGKPAIISDPSAKESAPTIFPHSASPTSAGTAHPAARSAYPPVGEISPALVREWGPLLKPTGLGLLLALHSFEETTPGHPHFGWAHCTQTALAAYLDTSQDTIARYSNLLLTCGLVQVEEVEIPRGKQKLYRVTRGLPLPSLGLLEYLLFDADVWTRKHTGWLTIPLAPLGPTTELTRLTTILGRAYRVTRDRAGVATLVDGRRLTAPGSYRARLAPARQSTFEYGMETGGSNPPCAVPIMEGTGVGESAAGGVGIPGGIMEIQADSASSGLVTSAEIGLAIEVRQESAPCGLETGTTWPIGQGRQMESASGGVGGTGSPHWAESNESASGGGRIGEEAGIGAALGKESALGGVDLGQESALGGLTGTLVNVNRESVKTDESTNVNGALASAGTPLSAEDSTALLDWGTAALNDVGSREWHRQCVADHGPDLYEWAIQATLRAQAKGRVSRPGAYFTSLVRRRGRSAESAPEATPGHEAPRSAAALAPQRRTEAQSTLAENVNPLAVPVGSAMPAVVVLPAEDTAASGESGLAGAACGRLWQAALIHLRVGLPAETYGRVLRYAVLLSLDPAGGRAVLGVPAAYMRDAIQGELAPAIAAALGLVCGAALRVTAVVR